MEVYDVKSIYIIHTKQLTIISFVKKLYDEKVYDIKVYINKKLYDVKSIYIIHTKQLTIIVLGITKQKRMIAYFTIMHRTMGNFFATHSFPIDFQVQ